MNSHINMSVQADSACTYMHDAENIALIIISRQHFPVKNHPIKSGWPIMFDFSLLPRLSLAVAASVAWQSPCPQNPPASSVMCLVAREISCLNGVLFRVADEAIFICIRPLICDRCRMCGITASRRTGRGGWTRWPRRSRRGRTTITATQGALSGYQAAPER